MDKKPYWFITVFENLKTSKDGAIIYDSRCWGFFSDRNEAVEVLHRNTADLWETIYDYAVLEEFHEGIGGWTKNRQFFKYNEEKDGYFEIPEPKHLKDHFTFAQIG